MKEEILKEIARRGAGLKERIDDRTLDKYVRTELINRFEALQEVYWWIQDNINESGT